VKSYFLVLALICISACSKNPEDRGITVFTDMVHSPAYEAYSENELAPDGRTMMDPVKGSIARGKMPHMYSNSEEDAIKAGEQLVDPYPQNARTLARGEYLYKNFCTACHGVSGEGDGPVISKKFPVPPSLKSSKIKEYSKGRIYHVITAGFGDMAPHGSQLTIEDRWYIAQYVKQFQK